MMRRSSDLYFLILAVAVALGGCVSAGGRGATSERSFRRPGVERVPLRTLDVVVVAAGPPRAAEAQFSVKTFPPPELETALVVGAEDAKTRAALVAALSGVLGKAGFDARYFAHGTAPSPPVPGMPMPVPMPSAVTPTGTSTTSTSTQAADAGTLAAPGPESNPAEPEAAGVATGSVEPGQTLSQFLSASTADAVLVVRVVPVDSWFVDVGLGTTVIETALGRERVVDHRPAARQGRLLVGQAFLFDRATGVRLWSKQAPDYPEGGWITPKHPFLKYGYMGQTRDRTALARASAAAFARTMLFDFPAAGEGDEAGRAALDTLDVDAENAAQEFLDQTHFGFEMGAGWGVEPSQLEVAFFDTEVEPLTNGAITPMGVPRLAPRLTWLTTSSWAWSVAVPFGIIPGSFGRVLHQDNPAPNSMNPDDRTVQLRVNGATTFGLEAHGGPMIRLGRHLLLMPRGGLFGEVWSIDTAEGTSIPETTRFRLGGLFGSDLMLLSGDDGGLYGRVGAEARVGADTRGPFILGAAFSAAVGFLL